MKQSKKNDKRYTTKEILELLDLGDNTNNNLTNNNNLNNKSEKECENGNNKKDKNKDKKSSYIETKELLNLEKEIDLFEKEEEQYIFENNVIEDKTEKNDPIQDLYYPLIEEDNITILSNKSNSSSEIKNEEENEFLGFNKETNDKYNNSGNNLNENNENIFDKTNSLNNLKNPFIRAAKLIEYKKIDLKKGDNGNEKKPPKFFNKSQAIELDKNLIEEINVIGVITDKNHWYNNIVYKGKKFNIISNKTQLNKSKNVSYYCSLHRTTKDNDNSLKENKKRISRCNARIVYIKDERKYYMDCDHSQYCQDNNNPFVDTLSDINKEVNNYKKFRKVLQEFLNANPLVTYKSYKEKAEFLYNKIECNFEIKKIL